MTTVVQGLSSSQSANLRREILATQFEPFPRGNDGSLSLAARFGIPAESIPALRAHLSIDARSALQAEKLPAVLETDLKLLALHFSNTAHSEHSNAPVVAEIHAAASRLGVPYKALKRAVEQLAAQMVPEPFDAARADLGKQTIRSAPGLKRSPSLKLEIRRAVLQELGAKSPDEVEVVDKKVARLTGVGESSIPAVRAWVGVIFPRRVCVAEGASIDKSKFPELVKAAAFLSERKIDPWHDRANATVTECARETGASKPVIRRVLERYLSRF